MINYSQFPRKNILCVDMKSFYAFVSAVSMGLNPLTCYLAVVGNTERQGSVVLAASPALKKDFGIKTGSKLFEKPENPRIHIVNPQMKLFIRVSTEITKLFYRFVPEKCVHTFSIDESFVDVKSKFTFFAYLLFTLLLKIHFFDVSFDSYLHPYE